MISPLLANLYLHYAFDLWMLREFPGIPFERYADDVICHCGSELQARRLKDALTDRFTSWSLTLHPEKTKIVYCKDDRRRGNHPYVQFDFLGYTFRPRRVKGRTGTFLGFNPGISMKSATALRQEMRGWQLDLRSDLAIEQIADEVNPALRGWINYYGVYFRSAMIPVVDHFDHVLSRWAMRKYKHLRCKRWSALRWVHAIARRQPRLFAHWTFRSAAG